MRWIPASYGRFGVQSYYRVLCGEVGLDFPWKGIWNVKAPLKISFFVRAAVLEAILTIDNLGRRGKLLPNWCCMRCRAGESLNHLHSTLRLQGSYGPSFFHFLALIGLCQPWSMS
uniref:Reverse transcriptase zinc-binding domain-containing protein n=1 Tax=Davidia involucrata TaxID=16924 RepID=A0A5B7C9P8_DAVIN